MTLEILAQFSTVSSWNCYEWYEMVPGERHLGSTKGGNCPLLNFRLFFIIIFSFIIWFFVECFNLFLPVFYIDIFPCKYIIMEKILLSKYVWKKNVRKLLIHFKITENLDLLCPTNLFCPYKEKSEMTLQQLTNAFITHLQRLYTLIDIY